MWGPLGPSTQVIAPQSVNHLECFCLVFITAVPVVPAQHELYMPPGLANSIVWGHTCRPVSTLMPGRMPCCRSTSTKGVPFAAL